MVLFEKNVKRFIKMIIRKNLLHICSRLIPSYFMSDFRKIAIPPRVETNVMIRDDII